MDLRDIAESFGIVVVAGIIIWAIRQEGKVNSAAKSIEKFWKSINTLERVSEAREVRINKLEEGANKIREDQVATNKIVVEIDKKITEILTLLKIKEG